jgi:hypothetical protein
VLNSGQLFPGAVTCGCGSPARQPVLMVFEDIHWNDPTTRESLDRHRATTSLKARFATKIARIVAVTRRDDIHTHDIAFDRSYFDPVEHRVNRFLGNTSHVGTLRRALNSARPARCRIGRTAGGHGWNHIGAGERERALRTAWIGAALAAVSLIMTIPPPVSTRFRTSHLAAGPCGDLTSSYWIGRCGH